MTLASQTQSSRAFSIKFRPDLDEQSKSKLDSEPKRQALPDPRGPFQKLIAYLTMTPVQRMWGFLLSNSKTRVMRLFGYKEKSTYEQMKESLRGSMPFGATESKQS